MVSFCILDEEAAGGSGDDFLKVDSAWHGDLDSDADSVDSEEEDPLKWALILESLINMHFLPVVPHILLMLKLGEIVYP